MSEQQELHTQAYDKHRNGCIVSLSLGAKRGHLIRWDGVNQSCLSVLKQVCRDTEDGKRFVRETSTNPDVQL